MKPLYRLSFLFLLLSFTSNAQTWKWAQQGTSPLTGVSYAANVYALAIDGSRNVFITGFILDVIYFGSTTLSTQPFSEVSFIAKYDSVGKFLWAQQSKVKDTGAFYHHNNSYGGSLATDKTGNVYEAGSFVDSVSFGSYNLASPNSMSGDMFLVKYSSAGNVVWAKQSLGSATGYAHATSLATDAQNNIYVAGLFASENFKADTIKVGTFSLISASESDVYSNYFLIKYDSNGNVRWVRQSLAKYATAFSNMNITFDNAGNLYACGAFADTLSWGSVSVQNSTLGNRSVFLAKFDTSGTALWIKQFKTDFVYSATTALTTDKLGNIYIAASYDTTITFGPYTLNSSKNALALVKCNANGLVLWAKSSIGNIYNEDWFVNELSADSYGHIYLTAYGGGDITFGADTLKFDDIGGNGGAMLGKFDTSGNLMCNSIFSQPFLGGVVAEPNSANVFIAGELSSRIQFGSYTLGPPADTAVWPFVAEWVGCKDSDFYARDSVKSPCSGQCVGTATAMGSGGYPPYSYLWQTNPVQTTQTITGLCPANYLVRVEDANQDTSYQLVIVPPISDHLEVTPTQNSICLGGKTVLNASGASSYIWVSQASLSCSNCPNPTTNPVSTSTYVVTGTDSLGCKDTTSVTIGVLPLPTISNGGNVCSGSSFTLTAAGGSSYAWSNGAITNFIHVSPDSTTKYSVITVVGNNACTDTLYGNVIVRQTPVVLLCCDSSITSGESVQLIVTGGGSYAWQPNTGLSCDTCSTPIARPAQTTTYTVLVTSDSGCSAMHSVIIEVSCHVFIPDAFSPNGDGQNDNLYVRGDCIKNMQFEVFDRWGNKVFETNDKSNGWDGTYNGKPMNTGSYVYYLSATMYDGATQTRKGNVTLVR